MIHIRATDEVLARLDLLADKLGTTRATAGFKSWEWSLPPLEERAA